MFFFHDDAEQSSQYSQGWKKSSERLGDYYRQQSLIEACECSKEGGKEMAQHDLPAASMHVSLPPPDGLDSLENSEL